MFVGPWYYSKWVGVKGDTLEYSTYLQRCAALFDIRLQNLAEARCDSKELQAHCP